MAEGKDMRAAFEAAFEEHSDALFRYFAYRLNSRDRALELAQETFLRAWDYAARGNPVKSLKPFLYTTAANLFKNELRDRKEAASLDILMDEGQEFAGTERTPEDDAEAKLVLARLSELEEPHQEILRLRFLDELSTREIAEALGISSIAVSVRIHRALGRLRAIYKPDTL